MVEVVKADRETIRLVGELDLSTIAAAESALAPLTTQPGSLSLDLSQVSFMGSEGVRLLIHIAKERMPIGPLVLLHPPPAVERLLALVGLEDLPNVTIRNGDTPSERESPGGVQ